MGAAVPQTRILAILDRLSKAAGADIARLIEEDTAAFNREIQRRDEQIETLQKRLQVTETELKKVLALLRVSTERCSVGVQVQTLRAAEAVPHRKDPGPASFNTHEDEKPPLPEASIPRPHRACHAPGGRVPNNVPGRRDPNDALGHALGVRDPNNALGHAPVGWDPNNALGHALRERDLSHAFGGWDPNNTPGGRDPGHAPGEDDEFSSLEFEMKIEQVEELVDQELSLQQEAYGGPLDPGPDPLHPARAWPCVGPELYDQVPLDRRVASALILGAGKPPVYGPAGRPAPRTHPALPLMDLQGEVTARDATKPFCCEQCGKGFTQRTRLITHKRTHTGERPYHCQHCGKMFSRQDNCLRHVRLHSGQRW